ncbi:MAG TPA: hypothetical protein VGO40_00635 [Longimicrobium sp.]|nr:hypothetical protein [Longimicrobium sp.]
MYAALGVDQNAAGTLSSGPAPGVDPPQSPDFEWLEHVLDAPDMEDLPLVTHEGKLAASRSTFLREWTEKQKKMETRSLAASAPTR